MNYKYRMHDPRIGRFFAVDPLASTYPYNSPYAFSENSVILFVELEGKEKSWSHIWENDIKGGFKEVLSVSNWKKVKDELVAEITGEKHHIYVKPKGTVENVVFQGGQLINSFNPITNGISVYQGVTTGQDAFENEFTKTDAGIEVLAAVPLFKPLKYGDEALDVIKAVDKTNDVRKITKPKWGHIIKDYGTTAIEHIKDGHFFDSRPGKPSSRFSQKNSTIARVKALTSEAVAKGTHAGTKGNYSVIHTFDEVIGTTSKGKSSKTLQVYLDESGNVINSYPIPDPKK